MWNKKKGFYCLRKELSGVACLGKQKGRDHPYISPESIKKLKEFYKKHDESLFLKIGEDPFW